MIVLACFLLAAGLFAYVFLTQDGSEAAAGDPRINALCERKQQIYDNLRDLNFEFKAGKYPQADFDSMRDQLEIEAAGVLAEIDRLQAAR